MEIKPLKKLALFGAIKKPIKISSTYFSEVMESSPQTAARRLQELEKNNLISRTIVPDGQWITITDKGIKLLRKEYYEYQQIFNRDINGIELIGNVQTGLGEGKYYIALNGYKKQFENKLGFTPFLGTLNLKLNPQSIILRKRLDRYSGINIEGFKSQQRTFGGGKCIIAKIKNNKVQEIEGAIVIPDRSHYPEDILEVIAPVNLRQYLRLQDGSEVRVEVI
ncbi:MAG: winged helix-turn-helix domain-containing protein/riboflavin kinase [Methanosarcinales archaeon]